MRSVELFTGAGGLALGLAAAGFEPALMVEWDDHAYETVKANQVADRLAAGWPFHHGDVRDVNFARLGDVDLVAGGPPCQPFSIGGKHRGRHDPRDMWPEAIRAVRELKPRAFLFENVRGLARESFADYLSYIVQRLRHPHAIAKSGETWDEHHRRLIQLPAKLNNDLRYHVEVHKINAADYGAAQKRHRVIIIGIRSDLELEWRFPRATHSRQALLWSQYITGEYWNRNKVPKSRRPDPSPDDLRLIERLEQEFTRPIEKPWVTVRDAIGDLPEPSVDGHSAIANHRFQPGARAYVGHTGSCLDQPAKALKAGDHGVPGGENMLARSDGTVRYFTIRECARLQGFPDNFVFAGSWTENMRQLGNAVPVPTSSAIAMSIASGLQRACEKNSKQIAA